MSATRSHLAPDDPRHGTPNGYHNLRCRCRPCTDAHTAWLRERRGSVSRAEYLARLAARPSQRTHGTRSTYNAGCRCPACTEAERVYRAAWRSR